MDGNSVEETPGILDGWDELPRFNFVVDSFRVVEEMTPGNVTKELLLLLFLRACIRC